jgi:acetyl esterase/lipase
MAQAVVSHPIHRTRKFRTTESDLRILELALKHRAILVTPDYRLRPESQLADSIDDMRDFWKWVQTSLPQLPGIEVDVSNLAVVGESAGGTFAGQAALLDMIHPIRVIIMQYPVLNIEGHLEWLESSPDAQKIPTSLLDDHVANVIPGHIVTRVPNGLRVDLLTSMLQNGRFADIKSHPYLDPIHSLEKAGPLPPVFLFHGRHDTSVRVGDSELWAEKLKKLQPYVPFHFVVRDGEHCFDQTDGLATPWLEEPIEFVEQYWPSRS